MGCENGSGRGNYGFGKFSAQIRYNVFMRILLFSPYHNHYRVIIIIVVFSNGSMLFNIYQ